MPRTTVASLREQARECLEASKRTDDEAVKNELLAAAAWLHEEAIKLEKLLNAPRGGGGPGSPAKRRNDRKMVERFSRRPPRYSQPTSQLSAELCRLIPTPQTLLARVLH